MDARSTARRVAGIAMLCLPLLAPAQGLLRGDEPARPRPRADPPETQSVKLPSGQLVKRLPGDGLSAAAAASAPTKADAAWTVQQAGNAQLRVITPPGGTPAATASRGPDLSVRQVGQARVLEIRGEGTPGLPTAAGGAALPAGVAVVDLPAGQAPPSPPAPNTIYRRAAGGG